jgi:hypothetical protein
METETERTYEDGVRDTLTACAEWFTEAHRNALRLAGRPGYDYSPEYLRGFDTAGGWVRHWAERGSPPERRA